jgi:predicted TIM-barrel fold metal-dependent hydrolase
LYVTNDYVIELCSRHSNMRFACSVHPYRKDAVAEIERCVKSGAVLMKWLPIVQDFNPADPKCFPVYEALAHYRLPLLSHTGGEKTLPCLDLGVADPMLLVPAIERGVTVIAAHCGTRSAGSETDFLPQFARLAEMHEHFYGDTSALNLPTRSYAWHTLLRSPTLRQKIIHGSDWPIPSLPPVGELGFRGLRFLREGNWMNRDVLIKQKLGLDEDYWHRAAKILRLEKCPAPRMNAN